MIAVSLEVVLAWIGGLILFAIVGRLIVWLFKRGHADIGDLFP